MKRFVAILAIAICFGAIVSLCSCALNETPPRILLDSAIYLPGTASVSGKWSIPDSREYNGGTRFTLEKKVNDSWEAVDRELEFPYVWDDMNYHLTDGRPVEFILFPYSLGLEVGKYRIRLTIVQNFGKHKEVPIQCYFDVV